MSVIRQMNKGDNVYVHQDHGTIGYYSNLYTQFMGFLLTASEPRIIFDAYHQGYVETHKNVTYTKAYENLGNGLNIADGQFTAPVSGIYYFHFQGLTDDGNTNTVVLKLNGNQVASSYRSEPGVSNDFIIS